MKKERYNYPARLLPFFLNANAHAKKRENLDQVLFKCVRRFIRRSKLCKLCVCSLEQRFCARIQTRNCVSMGTLYFVVVVFARGVLKCVS